MQPRRLLHTFDDAVALAREKELRKATNKQCEKLRLYFGANWCLRDFSLQSRDRPV